MNGMNETKKGQFATIEGHVVFMGGPSSGGGTSGSGVLYTTLSSGDVSDVNSLLKEVSTWEGQRMVIATSAIKEILKGGKRELVLQHIEGELKGIALLSDHSPKSKETYLSNLATKERGYGKALMTLAVEKAVERGHMLSWQSTSKAEAFYDALGFAKFKYDVAGTSFYDVPYENLRSWLAKKEDYAELEPDDGVFTGCAVLDSEKVRNWNVDDERNRDWIKLLLRLRGKKEAEVEVVAEVKTSVEPEKPSLLQRIGAWFGGHKPAAVKEAAYQVQPFHGNYYLEENKPWAMSPDDENAILKKGGWKLYKEMHLVCDCTDNPTPERKAAYTYPVAKLVNGRPTYFLKSAQIIYAGLRGGARGAKLPLQVNEDALKTVKKIYEAFGRDTEEMTLNKAFAFKAADGTDWWMQWTTNAFTDREGENFQTKALEAFVERHRGEKVKGEFWYHHIPGSKFGDVVWQAMVGRFLVQAGPFDATPVGQAFKEFFGSNPDGHPDIAPNGWGTSHGYQYDAKDRQDGVYEWVEIKESTVLPADAASNPWSPYPRIVKRSEGMNAQERKELEAIGGKQLVDLVLQEGEQRTKELEGRGVGYKSLAGGMAKLMALMEAMEDPDIKAALSEIYTELENPDEEMPMEEEIAAVEGAEAAEEMVEGMLEGEAACAPKPDGATKAEVGDALKAIVGQLRAEIVASQKATADSIAQTLQPLVEVVTELKRRDADKIAQKAAATPAASLRDMVQSVLDNPAAAVKADDPLRGKKPEETPMQQMRPTDGLPPFLASLLSGK